MYENMNVRTSELIGQMSVEPTDKSLVNMIRNHGIYFCNEIREDIEYLRRQDGAPGHKMK
jgi:hypothetical protein